MSEQTRTAIVTGCSRGIGLAIFKRLAADGFFVVGCARTSGSAEEVAARLHDNGLQAAGITADVSSETDAARVVDAALEWSGRVDVLVNNAGVYAPADFLELTRETWEETLAVNLTSALLCSQLAARAMIQNPPDPPPRGRIVMIASTNAFVSEPKSADYNVSKAGLVSLTKSMAIDLAPYSILTACVAPGWIDTDINAEYMSGLLESEKRRLNPLGRLGTPQEIADVVALLCDPRCSFVTGATIAVDGGQLGSSFKDI